MRRLLGRSSVRKLPLIYTGVPFFVTLFSSRLNTRVSVAATVRHKMALSWQKAIHAALR